MNIEFEIIKLVATLFLGGLAGALLTQWFTKHRSAIELTITVAQTYIKEFDNYGEALEVFQNHPTTNEVKDLNLARRLGDWWEMVATYLVTGLIDRQLFINLGLHKELLRFRGIVTAAADKANSNFQNARNLWPNLFEVK